MRRLLGLWLVLVSLFAVGTLSVACGRKDAAGKPPRLNPLQEAYRLMDQGENARAARLLEDQIAQGHGTDETHLLLASAYLGTSGLDIYSIHDSFADVLFAKSLGDALMGSKGGSGNSAPPTHQPVPVGLPSPGQDTLAEKTLHNLDSAIDEIRRMASLLSRFPQIRREHWPMVEQAIAQLESLARPTRDIHLYRLLARVVYIRSRLGQDMIGNPDFGTAEWACAVTPDNLKESLSWYADSASNALEDFRLAFPAQRGPMEKYQGMVIALSEELNDGAPAGSRTSSRELADELHRRFRCSERFSPS